MKRFSTLIIILVLAATQLICSAGIYQDNYGWLAFGDGIVEITFNEGKPVCGGIMLEGCKVTSVVRQSQNIMVLTAGIYSPQCQYASDNRSRIFYSSDGGKTYQDITPQNFLYFEGHEASISAMCYLIDSEKILITLYNNLLDGEPDVMFTSSDWGKNWEKRGEALGYYTRVLVPAQKNKIWCTSFNFNTDGIIGWFSPDGEKSKEYLVGMHANRQTPISQILPDSSNEQWALAADQRMILLTRDNGNNWNPTGYSGNTGSWRITYTICGLLSGEAPNQVYALGLNRKNMLEAGETFPAWWGLMVSNDNGQTWKETKTGKCEIENINPYTIDMILHEGVLYAFNGTQPFLQIPLTPDPAEIKSISTAGSEQIVFVDDIIRLPQEVSDATIFDIQGNPLLSTSGDTIDVQALSPGCYILKTKSQSSTSEFKFIKK